MSKIFLDTNILVYTVDQSDKKKHARAQQALQDAFPTQDLIISTQVLQEFYVACTKKLKIPALETKELLHCFSHFQTIVITPIMIEQAIDCSILHRLSFWDALIIISAETAKCTQIWSEDLNTEQVIRGITIRNPLK
jgi:predicted nucleic acid-binding protein